jgi:hypothetical protein
MKIIGQMNLKEDIDVKNQMDGRNIEDFKANEYLIVTN